MKNIKKIIKDNLNIIYMLINFVIFNLFITKLNVIFSKTLVDQIIFGFILIILPLFIFKNKNIKKLEGYNKISFKILIGLISLWISYSLIGSNLFLENINRFFISKLIYLAILTFAFIPLVLTTLFLLEVASEKVKLTKIFVIL